MRLPHMRITVRRMMLAVAFVACVLVVERSLFGFAAEQVTSHDEYLMGEAVTVWIILNGVLLWASWLIVAAVVLARRARCRRRPDPANQTDRIDVTDEL
jgi:dolichyl-phosphate-mannose--protein O-mannosyl transferase